MFNQPFGPLFFGPFLLAMAELGFRMGIRVPPKDGKALQTDISGYQAAVLGLLALLLGFTFSMALNHYDIRRGLVIEEANSIGTTYLRTSFLPSGPRDLSRSLIREYVDLRLQDESSRKESGDIRNRIAVIERELWKQAEISVTATPSPIMATYINSLNETFDQASTQVASSRYRVPCALWMILIIVSVFGIWAAGFSAGLNGRRALFLTVGLPILITLVMLLITDMSTPSSGLIRTDYSSMSDLKESLK